MPLDNNYVNPMLTTDGYYRQNLSSVKGQASYYKDDDKSFIKESIMLAGLVAATGGTAHSFYKSGGFRQFMNKFLVDFANSEGVRKFIDASDGVKKVTERSGYNVFQDVFDIVHNNTVTESIKIGAKNRAESKVLYDTEIIKNLTEKYNVVANLKHQKVDKNIINTIHKQMDEVLKKTNLYDFEYNSNLMREVGLRQARVKDLANAGRLSGDALEILALNKNTITDIMDKVADKNIMVSMSGEIIDFRDGIDAIRKMGLSAIRDFQIPVLGINPAKMFHLDDLIEKDTKPLFHTIGMQEVQPYISGRTTELRNTYVFAGDKIIDTVTGNTIRSNMELTSARHGYLAINTRRMTGIEMMKKQSRWDNPFGRGAFKIAQLLDIDMQDEVYHHNFDLLTPATWLTSASEKIRNIFSPVENTNVKDLRTAYGIGVDDKATKYLVMNKSKKIGEEGFIKQLYAGRKNINEVTKATHVPYMLMERMNASLQAFNLGMSSKSIGSVGDVFVNLMGKRILPVVAAIGVIRYADYLLEDKNGNSPKDAIADTYVTASVNLAGAKDKLGITGFFKKLKDLSPGWDQLEGMPLIGKLFSTKDKAETEEYWKNGEDEVRKGRYWTLGNTPYTGGRVEYFKPNWARRTKSDYKFTDVLYGSKDEYFKNWWLPTPTSPFAPIKHFVTDPYHYEKKHYKDRPYPITGGIAELKEIPIIGGFLDATVGQLLKPRTKMHLEYWEGERLKEPGKAEDTPYQELTRPEDRLVGPAGRHAIPIKKNDEYESVVYTTSSGQMEVMAKRKDEDLRMLNNILKNVSVKQAGGVGSISKGEPKYGPLKDETMIPIKPGGITSSLEDAYYDVTELAGFYGFSFTTLAGDGVAKRPRVQGSDEIQSYSRGFWDMNLGGFGGDVSEMFRRFVPNKRSEIRNSELNPIRNTMPTWMPGKEYYIDFLHGDPYIKVDDGEYRLPGAGYEAMHGKRNPLDLWIGSSQIGHSKEDIVKHFLKIDDIELADNVNLKTILKSGTSVHEKMEKEWEKLGLAVAHEVYVKDDDLKIEGYIDSIIRDKSSKTGYAIVDYKTISNKGYKELMKTGGKPENIAQIQFYLYKTGQEKGYLHYINRDDTDAPVITFEYKYNKKLMEHIANNVEDARNVIRQGINSGEIQRGDLYSIMDRFRILADVAPYSENFRMYDRLMSKMELKEDEKEEVAQIRKQVLERKQPMRLYPYKFSTANIKYEKVTVKDVLDNGTITTEEYDENPIKLAGIDFSSNLELPEGKAAMNYLRKRLRKGQTIMIGYNEDPIHKFEKDTYRTINAVVKVNGDNLNRTMLQKEYAKERENDDSPAGIHARYSAGEITYGKIWESLTHRDTYFHTKFMQTRSALEMYKRRDVYGKDWQEWTHPIKDFLLPSIQNQISKGPLTATIMGALIGSMFGKTRYGKIVGASIGGASMMVASTAVAVANSPDGVYIPKRRQKERELNEYIDILKYVKNRKLYEQYRKMAIKKEGVDPQEIIDTNSEEGSKRKERIQLLTSIKRKINAKKISIEEARKSTGLKAANFEELIDLINKQIESLKNHREVNKISPLAAQAIMYYNESEKTAYGYDPGEPLQNILYALNRKERKYFMPFLEAPEEERDEIIKLTPKYMRRALQSAYGMKVDDKPDLEEYFKNHALPSEDWAGWNPEVDLEDVKVKLVKHEGMDMSEFDYWPDDEMRAEYLDIPVPKINFHQTADTVRKRLRDVLRETGLDTIDVQVNVTNTEGVNMDVNIENDRSEEVRKYVNNYGVL